MARSIRPAAALAVTAALLLAGCGSDSEGSADEATTTTAAELQSTTAAQLAPSTTEADGTTTTEAGGGETTTTEASSEGRDTETSELDTLTDGDHYGYIAGLEEGVVEGQAVQVIIWDEVELLSGQEAIDAAAEDGATLDTDYYIRNQNQTVRRLAVVPDASATTLSGSESVPSSVTEVADQEFLFKVLAGNVRGITTLSSIDAVYLP